MGVVKNSVETDKDSSSQVETSPMKPSILDGVGNGTPQMSPGPIPEPIMDTSPTSSLPTPEPNPKLSVHAQSDENKPYDTEDPLMETGGRGEGRSLEESGGRGEGRSLEESGGRGDGRSLEGTHLKAAAADTLEPAIDISSPVRDIDTTTTKTPPTKDVSTTPQSHGTSAVRQKVGSVSGILKHISQYDTPNSDGKSSAGRRVQFASKPDYREPERKEEGPVRTPKQGKCELCLKNLSVV